MKKRIAKALQYVTLFSLRVDDRPDGHFSVSVLGIPVFDSERRERRLARRKARK